MQTETVDLAAIGVERAGSAAIRLRRHMAALALLVLSACAVPVGPRVQVPQPRLTPEAMGVVVSLVQRLTIERSPEGQAVETRSLDTMLEVDTTSVRMAAFALGQRVLTLTWDGASLTSSRHPLLPAEVDAAYVLRDIQWMYAPFETLRQALPPDWLLDDVGNQRILSHGTVPVLVIRYDSDSRWTGRSRLENRVEGYSLTIESTTQPGS